MHNLERLKTICYDCKIHTIEHLYQLKIMLFYSDVYEPFTTSLTIFQIFVNFTVIPVSPEMYTPLKNNSLGLIYREISIPQS